MVAPKRKSTPAAPKNRASEIAPGVYVGGWKEAAEFEGVRFCVLDERPEDMPAATHIPIYDGATDRAIPGNLDKVARGMREARAKGQPVIVFCGHGVRRSPLAGAWYLHRHEGMTLDQAYAKIRTVRPKIEVASDWVGHPENLA